MTRRRARASADYEREDATLRGVWLATSGLTSERDIALRAGCSPSDAARVAMVRASATPDVITAWLDARVLSWRQLARIVLLESPRDSDGQLVAARTYPAFARWERLRIAPAGPPLIPAPLRRAK